VAQLGIEDEGGERKGVVMSYYESNYYRNPGPVYAGSDVDEPVPGWGPLPNMAGPARVGVGIEVHSTAIPLWKWAVGAALIAGLGYGSYKLYEKR
jgi:hypothetical protein